MGIETILWVISKLSQLHQLNHFRKSQTGQIFSYLKVMRVSICYASFNFFINWIGELSNIFPITTLRAEYDEYTGV